MNYPTDFPLIAILRGILPHEILGHTEALVQNGFKIIEVPTNSPNWQESLAILIAHYANHPDIIIGAGTVTSDALLDTLIEVGGKIMVTPNLDPALIQKAKKNGMLTCPGALTPSEIFAGINAGADIIKIFPVTAFPQDYIKAIRSVVPKTQRIFAVGGITTDNLQSYYQMGYQGFGLGSDLYRAGQSVESTLEKAHKYAQKWQEIDHENH